MYIKELKEGAGGSSGERETLCEGSQGSGSTDVVVSDTKRVVVGVGARALFYPTLLYNVIRNKIQADFRWWDKVDEFVLLGAVPFPTDVLRLKELGVSGVITLNESYETLVPSALYHTHSIDHLVIPTRDYYFAPSLRDICQAVNFIHKNAICRKITYVHCKAGRGRSTTIVLCYLVQHKGMTPKAAFDYVRSIRPRVLLASSQWQAVQEYYRLTVNKIDVPNCLIGMNSGITGSAGEQDVLAFDDGTVVVVTDSDLNGYDPSLVSGAVRGEIWANLSLVYRVGVAGKAALARISCLWLRCSAEQKIPGGKMGADSRCSMGTGQLGGLSVDIRVF